MRRFSKKKSQRNSTAGFKAAEIVSRSRVTIAKISLTSPPKRGGGCKKIDEFRVERLVLSANYFLFFRHRFSPENSIFIILPTSNADAITRGKKNKSAPFVSEEGKNFFSQVEQKFSAAKVMAGYQAPPPPAALYMDSFYATNRERERESRHSGSFK